MYSRHHHDALRRATSLSNQVSIKPFYSSMTIAITTAGLGYEVCLDYSVCPSADDPLVLPTAAQSLPLVGSGAVQWHARPNIPQLHRSIVSAAQHLAKGNQNNPSTRSGRGGNEHHRQHKPHPQGGELSSLSVPANTTHTCNDQFNRVPPTPQQEHSATTNTKKLPTRRNADRSDGRVSTPHQDMSRASALSPFTPSHDPITLKYHTHGRYHGL